MCVDEYLRALSLITEEHRNDPMAEENMLKYANQIIEIFKKHNPDYDEDANLKFQEIRRGMIRK